MIMICLIIHLVLFRMILPCLPMLSHISCHLVQLKLLPWIRWTAEDRRKVCPDRGHASSRWATPPPLPPWKRWSSHCGVYITCLKQYFKIVWHLNVKYIAAEICQLALIRSLQVLRLRTTQSSSLRSTVMRRPLELNGSSSSVRMDWASSPVQALGRHIAQRIVENRGIKWLGWNSMQSVELNKRNILFDCLSKITNVYPWFN